MIVEQGKLRYHDIKAFLNVYNIRLSHEASAFVEVEPDNRHAQTTRT